MTLNITEKDALDLLADVVEAHGRDHIAQTPTGGQGCTYYVHGGRSGNTLTPVCIVGQVLANLGILRATMSPDYGDQQGACTSGSLIWENAARLGVVFDEDARSLLREAQSVQDSGSNNSWGEAFDFAKRQVLVRNLPSEAVYLLDY